MRADVQKEDLLVVSILARVCNAGEVSGAHAARFFNKGRVAIWIGTGMAVTNDGGGYARVANAGEWGLRRRSNISGPSCTSSIQPPTNAAKRAVALTTNN
jgi:hypothetical protein